MFKKLLSNLPFNPSLIGQVSFYAKRMHREAALRRMGVGMMVLAILVQVFAVVSPPEPTLAESNNDIVKGGFTTRDEAVNHCRSNTKDFANILVHYGVTCEALGRGVTKTISTTDKRLDSLGRVAQGPTIARTGKPTEEYPITINGTEYYMKNLWAWDSGSSSSYKVLEVKNAQNQTIMIMFSCGNIVTIDKYTPPPPPEKPKPEKPKDVCTNIPGVQTTKEECDTCPNVPGTQSNKSECYPCPKAKATNTTTACLELSKSASNQTQKIQNADNTVALADDVIVYTLRVQNTGTQAVKGFVIEEDLSDTLEYATATDLSGGQLDAQGVVSWPKQDIAAGTIVEKHITVRVKNPIPQTPASASDPGSFNLVMTNVYYGTAVNIKLPASSSKSVEMAVTSMPNTGPGTTLAIGFIVLTFMGYFLARSTLLAKEVDLVRADYTSVEGS
ncbi:MAG TPA: hypothetical protein VK694_07425 [Verrucomicrobiae bacterium]|nr:hypothetical protein [Verrucomicrobiae bacterium]